MRESIRRQVQLPAGDETLTLLVTVALLKDEENLRPRHAWWCSTTTPSW